MKHHYTRLLLTSLIITAALAAAITNASASRLSISNRNIRVTWTSLELSNTITSEVLRCPVTLEGSFTESTIRKVLRALIGVISRATNGTCIGGTATIRQETLPWRLTYDGFTGTLPNITSIKLLLIRAMFEIMNGVATCRAETTEEEPAVGIANLGASGEVSGLRAEEATRIRLRGGLCGLGEGSFSGTGTVTLLGNTTQIRVTLIGEEEAGRLEPSPVSFGTVEPSELAVRTVTITAATAGFTVNSIKVTNGNYYAITDPNRCIGDRLGSRARCAFKVVFVAPGEAGRRAEDTVTVETSREVLRDAVSGAT